MLRDSGRDARGVLRPLSAMTDRPANTSSLKEELKQSRPFRAPAQEVTIALLRTASIVNRQFARIVEPHGLSLAQYNVLRILRGAGADGLPTLAIRDRMIDEGSTVTRLLDKLEDAKLVSRDRSRPDRRQVLCRLTHEGATLLGTLDPVIDAAHEVTTTAVSADERQQLLAVLATIRAQLAIDTGSAD